MKKLDSIQADIDQNVAKKTDVDRILKILDYQSDLLEVDEIERLALTKQVNRLQDWVERTAPKVSTKLRTE